eukprot:11790649-Karenia_brevis.AAC.1
MPHKRSYHLQQHSWTRRQVLRWRRDAWYRPVRLPAESGNSVENQNDETCTASPAKLSGNPHRPWADILDDEVPESWEGCLLENTNNA